MSRPLILVTNDDGITASGIRHLIEAVEPFGDVVVVAPDKAQSGMGHAVTIGFPLRIQEVSNLFGRHKAWQTSGTPVDCVKLAVDKILHKKPDLLVSGINHGSNASINVIYSGTMSAAVEGAIEGIPSIGFSLCDYSPYADFSLAQEVVKEVVGAWFRKPQPELLLNVNIPKISVAEYQGLKVCRQAHSKWSENFDERQDPNGRPYFWMKGEFVVMDQGDDTDDAALKSGFATVVPVQFDMTAHHRRVGISEMLNS